MNNNKVAHIMAILLMTVWSLSYLSIKVIVEEVEPTLSAFYRFLIAAIILYVINKIKHSEEKILKEDRVKMMFSGVFGVAVYFFFENYSVAYTSAANVAILIATIPIFTLFSQRIIFKEKLTLFKIIGAAFSVFGIVIIIASKERVSLFSKGSIGDLMALGAVMSWIIYNIITSKFKGNYKSLTVTTYQLIWGTVFLSPALIINYINRNITIPSKSAVINILFLSILCSCIGYLVYIYCLKELGATIITTYINLQPIISLIAARAILKEAVTIWQVIGCMVIILGVFLVSFGDNFKLKIGNVSKRYQIQS